MQAFRIATLFLVALALPLLGCGDSGGGGGGSAAAPTKASMVSHLESLMAAIEGKKWDEAAGYLSTGKGMPSRDDVPEALAGLVKKREISAAGIAILAEKGTFGTLADAIASGTQGKGLAKRRGVPEAECYALHFGDAFVAVHASGDGLKLLELDDVGKLN